MTLQPLNDEARKSLQALIELMSRQGREDGDRSGQEAAGKKNRQLKNATRSI
jgi:hypothetical protein